MTKKRCALIWCEKPGVFTYIVKGVMQVTGFRDCHDAAKDAVANGFNWLLVTEDEMLKLIGEDDV